MVTLAAIIYIALNQNSAGKYEKSIIRDTETAEEENALVAAENVNYTDVFKTDRFTGLSNSNLSDYSSYTYANFIDAVVIKYYDNRFESLKGKPRDMKFNYTANVQVWDKIHAVYVPAPENESKYTAKVRILSSNGTILNEYTGYARYAYSNASGIQEVQASAVDFEFSNCYVVEMRLEYSEIYGNVGAFFSDVNQTVIIDESYNPLFTCIQSSMAVS
jgi:hypothetical protein